MLNDDLKTLVSEIKFSRPKYMNSQTVNLFEGEKYKNNVSKVYIQLFTMNVVVKNVEKFVWTVLTFTMNVVVKNVEKFVWTVLTVKIR